MLCLLSYALLIFHFTHFFPSSSTFQVPKRSLPSYQNSLTRPPTSLCLLFLGRIGKERDGTGSCAQITVFPRAPLHIHTWISLLITEWQQVFPKCSFTWNHKTWVGPQLYYSSLWKVREGSQLLIFFFPPKIIANPEIDIGDQRSGIKTAELWLIKVILENKALALWPYWPPNTCAFKSSDYLTPFPTVLETPTHWIYHIVKDKLDCYFMETWWRAQQRLSLCVWWPLPSSAVREGGQPLSSGSPCSEYGHRNSGHYIPPDVFHHPAVWPWPSFLTSLRFCFLRLSWK